jgi:hypothetical protein
MPLDPTGLPIQSLKNPYLQVDFFTAAGPRLVGLFLAGKEGNLLAELPDLSESTPFGEYHFYGGHRLWHAPEDFPRTYIPDNHGLTLDTSERGIRLCGAIEIATGVQKTIHVELTPDSPKMTLRHEIKNCGMWPVELAAWALTQFRLGGVAIFPQNIHPWDASGLQPNRQLALWPYSQWSDPRLVLRDDFIFLKAVAKLPPIKIGYANTRGWIGYLLEDVFICKRIPEYTLASYPDFGSNVESYCNHRFIELETLSPLTKLAPGQSLIHHETWEIYRVATAHATIENACLAIETLNLI